MEENKQITCNELLKAIEQLPEEEKELFFDGDMFNVSRTVCASEEALELYRNILLHYINIYQTYLNLVQKVYDIVNKK